MYLKNVFKLKPMSAVLRTETFLDHLIDILYLVYYYGLSKRNVFFGLCSKAAM